MRSIGESEPSGFIAQMKAAGNNSRSCLGSISCVVMLIIYSVHAAYRLVNAAVMHAAASVITFFLRSSALDNARKVN